MQLYYKYTRPERFRWFFENGTVAFPKFSQLNDPFESSIESTLDHLRQDFLQLTYWEKRPVVKIPGPGGFPTYAEVKDWDDARPKREHNEKIQRHNSERRSLLNHLLWCRENIGICSMTLDPENVVMWAHYAQNGSGVCIGFDFSCADSIALGALAPELQGHEHLFQPLPIEYAPRRPSYSNRSRVDYVKSAFLTKYERWDYEQEIRLLRPTSCCSAVKGVPVLTIPRECIAEVNFGAACTQANVEAVKGMIRDLPAVKLKQVCVKQGDYRLTRTDL